VCVPFAEPDAQYLTDRDRSSGSQKCVLVKDVLTAAKLEYYTARLLQILAL
jgi:hypothetical protein